MRLAVLADVHANLQALEAVLRALEDASVDAYVVAGDLVGYGPAPAESIDRVLGLPERVAVAGNHDLALLGRLAGEHYPPLARESLAWTRERLPEAALAALAALPERAAVGPVAVAHGSPGDPECYVRTPGQLASALAAVTADLLVLGHTHEPLLYGERRGVLLRGHEGSVALDPGERYVLNPGSVGQARERQALARFAVLDLDRGEAAFGAVRYDAAATRRALRRAGRPPWSCHLSPARGAQLRRRVWNRLRARQDFKPS